MKVFALILSACLFTTPTLFAVGVPATQPAATQPSSVDLRPKFLALDLGPRHQGHRGTCSVFTTAAAMEYALSTHYKKTTVLSVEYLNWAANQATGYPSDGQFFHNALRGFHQFGICLESEMPYQHEFDPKEQPTTEAKASAEKLLKTSGIKIHWIKQWQPNDSGLSASQLQEVKQSLAKGIPVASGASHSRLLVGYQDDKTQPGGGVFLTKDSGAGRFAQVTYEFVTTKVNDAFWVECSPSN